MKLSIAWIFDHIDADWTTIDIKALVERFNQTTAEIEGVIPVTTNLQAFTLAQITAIDNDAITVFSPEWQKSYSLPVRTDAVVGSWYLTTERSWVKSPDVGGGKEHIFPALECPQTLRSGAWKNHVQAHDYILEIDNKSITNRPDLWGHRGVAREVAALLDVPLKPIDDYLASIPVHDTNIQHMPLALANPEPALCKRFTGLCVSSVTYTPTLITHVFRLARVDVKPINAIVDATNYVMFDIGQPMHAFDLNTVSQTIMPRRAHAGEKLTLLDGQKITLQPTDLVIADKTHALSLAGIMGGSTSAVTPRTHALFVEAACFDPATIRHASGAHKVRTDASARFEKNLDPEQTTLALKRFVRILRDAHIPVEGVTDIVSLGSAVKPLVITLSHRVLEDRLGIAIETAQVEAILKNVGFVVHMRDNAYDITVPSWRATKDVTIKEDIIEEVARFFGYTNIPAVLPYKQTQPHDVSAVYRVRTIKHQLAYGLAFNEISTYALYDEHFLRALRWEPEHAASVKNPVSENWRRLITSLVPHVVKAVAINSTDHDTLRFFEWGRTWHGNPIVEQKRLAGIIFDKKNPVDFYQTKAELNSLFDMMALPVTWVRVETPEHPWFMPHQTAHLMYNNQSVGFAGKVNPLFLHTIAEGDAFIFELNGDFLLNYKPATFVFAPQSKYPAVVRDVSMLVPLQCTADEITTIISSAHETILHVQLVDFFEKDTWKDQRSYTFRFTIQDEHKTLTKAEVDAIYDKVVAGLSDLNATIR